MVCHQDGVTLYCRNNAAINVHVKIQNRVWHIDPWSDPTRSKLLTCFHLCQMDPQTSTTWTTNLTTSRSFNNNIISRLHFTMHETIGLVAGILPKCRRHVANIPANEGNQPPYSPMMPVTIYFVIRLVLSGVSIRPVIYWPARWSINDLLT